jgi:hypothetical protein
MGNMPAKLTGKYKSYDISDHRVDVPSLTLKRHISIYNRNDNAINVDSLELYRQQQQQQPFLHHQMKYNHVDTQMVTSIPASTTTTTHDDDEYYYDGDDEDHYERNAGYANGNRVENDAMYEGAYGRPAMLNKFRSPIRRNSQSNEGVIVGSDDDDLYEAARYSDEHTEEARGRRVDTDETSHMLQVVNEDSNLDDNYNEDEMNASYDPTTNDLHADGVSRLTESVDLTPGNVE